MTTTEYIARCVIPATRELLPDAMDTVPAWAMVLAIGRQESDTYRARVQYRGGPAKGFWQFEMNGGVAGVLEHPSTRDIAASVCRTLGYPLPTARTIHAALEHNDVLACAFARLLLWTDPRALPTADNPTQGWLIYLATWRPGKPHVSTWAAHFDSAWQLPGTVTA